MKNKITALAILFLVSLGIHAQVDRSKQPKPGPAPKINLGTPETFTLDNGLKVLVVENHKLPRVSMTLTMDNPPHPEGNKAGESSLMGSLLGTGTDTLSKDAFNERIDFLGANVNFFSGGASANTLSKYFPTILQLVADGALHPKFTQEEFDIAKKREMEGLKSIEKDVSQNASRLRSALAYGKNHPYGELETPETLSSVTLENIKTYYNTYFVPQNAYLVIVGDTNEEEVKPLVEKYFADWQKDPLPNFTLPEPENVQYTQIDFLNMPNAVQSEISLVNTVHLKMSDKDYFPTLVANQILGGGAEGRLFLNLREDKGYTYGAYSSIDDDKYVSTFTASASVRNAVTDSAVVAFLDELHRIRNTKVSPQELQTAKAKYVGNFVMALERPSTIARYALNIETQDLSKDFYKEYLQKINAVTAEDVQRAAQKYFLADHARIVVAGKGSEVLPGLENVTYNGKNIPVLYFDKEGNKVKKPEFNTAIDPSVTVKSIFDNYLKAIGGEEAVEDVKSVVMKAQAQIQGQTLDLVIKQTADGKSVQEVSMGGNVVSKQVFNGETGFVVARGQKIPFNDAQAEAAKEDGALFPEMDTEGAKLMGMEQVDGKDAYAVALNDKTTAYYDVESGLKVKSVKTVSQGDQTVSVPTGYSNYKEASGVKFPFTISQSFGPQSLEFNISSISVNEGVSDSDFE